MSRDERKSACPPSWKAPTSKETRVRVELLAKIIPSVFPASDLSRYVPAFIRAARSKRARSSAREKSGMARKWRVGLGFIDQGVRGGGGAASGTGGGGAGGGGRGVGRRGIVGGGGGGAPVWCRVPRTVPGGSHLRGRSHSLELSQIGAAAAAMTGSDDEGRTGR